MSTAKQIGLDFVEASNEGFMEIMRRQARLIAIERGSVTTDDLRDFADQQGITPTHGNAWGAVFRKGWKPIGFEPSRRPGNHARVIRRWVLS